jgi:hypothetical protein
MSNQPKWYELRAAASDIELPYRATDEELYSANRVKTYFGENVAVAKLRFEYGATTESLGCQLWGYVSVDGDDDYRLRARYRRQTGEDPFTYVVDGCHRDGTVYIAARGDATYEPSGPEVTHDKRRQSLSETIDPVLCRLGKLELVCDPAKTHDHLKAAGLWETFQSFAGEQSEVF